MRCLAALLSGLALSAATQPGAPVTIAVSGITASQGKVHVDICPEKQFTREDCPWQAEAPAVAGTTEVIVKGVPPGRYAAQAYYDKNGNGKADRNFIGMPKELVGFSNDVVVHLSRPKFSAAAFEHDEKPLRITFAVRKIP